MTGEGLLRCACGDDEFAIRAGEVRHVCRADQLRPDDTPDGRIGVVKLAGQLVPVFRLRAALALRVTATESAKDQHIAVTGDDEHLVGWLVDRLTREPDSSSTRIAALPRSVGGRARIWFDGVVTCADDRVMLLINASRLNPLAPAVAPQDDHNAALTFTPSASRGQTEPVAVVFSTSSLPPAPVDKFALSGRQVAAILQPTPLLRVPGCAPHIAGLMLWRDTVVSVMEFQTSTREEDGHRRRLIAQCTTHSRALVALTIDADVVMHRPSNDDALVADLPCPPYVNGVFTLDGDHVALLNLDALVA